MRAPAIVCLLFLLTVRIFTIIYILNLVYFIFNRKLYVIVFNGFYAVCFGANLAWPIARNNQPDAFFFYLKGDGEKNWVLCYGVVAFLPNVIHWVQIYVRQSSA